MNRELETALKTGGITYAVLGLGGIVSQPVTQSVTVVAVAAVLGAVAGGVAYFLSRPATV